MQQLGGMSMDVRRGAVVTVIVGMLAALAYGQGSGGRTVVNFNDGWRFAKGAQVGAEKPEFDDSGWQAVRLPHDWAIAGPFNPSENGYAGKLPWRGEGWYRKTFTLDSAGSSLWRGRPALALSSNETMPASKEQEPNVRAAKERGRDALDTQGQDALATEDGRRVYFDFDGVMAFPKVYVNGQLAGEWDYGYMSFRVDATPYVKFGAKNTIAVYVDTRQHGTRWYPGAGIYRKVTMTICNPVHLAHWGTYVTTPDVSDSEATVRIRSTIENHRDTAVQVTATTFVFEPEGKPIAKAGKNETVPAGGSREIEQTIVINKPERWDITSPRLYVIQTALRVDGKTVDADATPFGIRTFQFTANDGFHLNGRRVQLHGVCLHHDQGPLGAAFYPRAMERQLEIMRDMGVNAIRTSHNPPAPELLDLCDRMGFVVWDEAFDKWDGTADRVARARVEGVPPSNRGQDGLDTRGQDARDTKTPSGRKGGTPSPRGETPALEQYGEKQLRNFVLRDRNHPSIVVWSVANELGGGGRDGVTPERVKFMSDFVRKYDATRPVGMACHIPGLAEQPNFDALDLTGWNYARRYATYRRRYPDKPIIYSESASALSTRGFYDLPLPNRKNEYSKQLQVDSYDLNAADWSDIPDCEFKLMQDDPFVAGEFVWTGFDYLGEPTPFSQEAKNSYFGIVDLCGIPKDRFYLYRSYWRPDTTTVHLLPHWNWPDRIGKNVPVFVYTNGDSAELFLNGKSLGRRQKGVIPPRPENFAKGKPAIASSNQPDHPPAHANDGGTGSRWTAVQAGPEQWWQVDLGEVKPICYIAIDFEREEKNCGYQIKVSTDASAWQTIVTKNTSRQPQWGGPTEIFHEVDTQARYVRIEFTDMRNGAWASIKEFAVYPQPAESPYYDVTYTYRLRWNDVTYEPGELKAVAYKNGQPIGEAIMRTAGKPATLRLTPDRKELWAGGDDLCYVLVEAQDDQGALCPSADNLVRFQVDGPAEIAAVGNGNPLSIEPFQADYRKLFYGKAMLILRTKPGEGGTVRVTATSDGLATGEATVSVPDPSRSSSVLR
jgi:beta-galactosidase